MGDLSSASTQVKDLSSASPQKSVDNLSSSILPGGDISSASTKDMPVIIDTATTTSNAGARNGCCKCARQEQWLQRCKIETLPEARVLHGAGDRSGLCNCRWPSVLGWSRDLPLDLPQRAVRLLFPSLYSCFVVMGKCPPHYTKVCHKSVVVISQ